jgi:16S rRNA (guanine527-N7)-methyltransferase
MPATALRAGLDALGLELQDDVQAALLRYVELLRRWNRVYNLTAVDDPQGIVTRHLLDALAVLPWVPAGRLVDVGSGAGLPGIPLALARPELDVTLLDRARSRQRPPAARARRGAHAPASLRRGDHACLREHI